MDTRGNTEMDASDELVHAATTEDFTSRAIGDFGKWQFRISFLMSLMKFPLAWFQLSIVFLAPPQDFWCQKPQAFHKYSDAQWKEICKPVTEELPCLIFEPDLLVQGLDRELIPLVKCPKFIYDNRTYTRTITSDWDLVCSRHWLIQLSQFVLMWGILLGSIVFGSLADKYGRKKPLYVAIVVQTVMAYSMCFVPDFQWFIIFNFILALASGGIYVISFVLCMEVVGGEYRTTVPILYQLPYGVGNTIMALTAYYVRDWRKFHFLLATFSTFFLLYWRWIPESPRWLLATGRIDEALIILKNAAAVNNKTFPTNDAIQDLKRNYSPSGKKISFCSFLKSRNLRLKTVLLSINWFFTGASFFTFSQYLGHLATNIYLMVAVGGLISTPGFLVSIYFVKVLGRKTAVAVAQISTGLSFLLILFISKEVVQSDLPRILLAGIGLAFMSVSVPALFLFTGELYPTVGRNVGVGGVTTFARIGSMVAPIIVALKTVSPRLPLVLLACCCFVQTLTLYPLPETRGCPLPDTVDCAEQFDKSCSRYYRTKKQRTEKN